MVVESRLMVVIMETDAAFEAGLGPISKQLIEIGRDPFRSPIQVFETFGGRNEVLMIVAHRENDFVQIPIDCWPDKIIHPIEPSHIVEIKETDLIAFLHVEH